MEVYFETVFLVCKAEDFAIYMGHYYALHNVCIYVNHLFVSLNRKKNSVMASVFKSENPVQA